MTERKLINATSTDAVCIQSTGEGHAVTAAGWQWLNYRDEALRVPKLIEACHQWMEAAEIERGRVLALEAKAAREEASEQTPRFVQGHVE